MGDAAKSIGGGGSGGSVASAALGAAATMLQAQGTADSYDYKAGQLEVAAQYGDLRAVQTGAQLTRQLNQTLGNIDAVRAAVHADPNSVTGAAFRDNQDRIGNEQKSIVVGGIKAQAAQDRADAAYYRSASRNALLAGGIGAAAGLLKGLAPVF